MTVQATTGHLFQSLDEFSPVGEFPQATVRNVVGIAGFVNPGPQGFLVEQHPGLETDTHFHPVDQFQILFGSPGSYYRRTSIPRVFVHYTDAYSVYGPFGSGEQAPLIYFTLRGTATDFHGGMPDHRSESLYRGKRHYELDLEPLLRDVATSGQVETDSLLNAQDDGLALHLARLGPDTQFSPPDGELRSGRYTVVLEGEIHLGDKRYGPLSVGWSSGEIDDVSVTSGPDGAAVLFLHLPYPATPSAHAAAEATA